MLQSHLLITIISILLITISGLSVSLYFLRYTHTPRRKGLLIFIVLLQIATIVLVLAKGQDTDWIPAIAIITAVVTAIVFTCCIISIRRSVLELKSFREDCSATLLNAREKVEEAERLKAAFIHNISHEIRTPMNAIVGFTALLGEPGITPEDQKSYLQIMTQSSDHLLSIVNDIIEISNIEAGKLRLHKNRTDICDTLKMLSIQFRPIILEKKLEFRYSPPPLQENLFITTDTTRFVQILTNLLDNAVKFTEKGFIDLSFSVNHKSVIFRVEDTGIGIPEDKISKIFDRFYQIDGSDTRMREGTGLGLSLCKAYAESLGGKIWIKSTVGKGSVFFLSIPLDQESQNI